MNWKPRGILLLCLAFTVFAGLAVWRMSDGWSSKIEDQELMSLTREATAAARQAQAYNEMYTDRLMELVGRELALRQTDPEARLPRSEFVSSEFASLSLIKVDKDGNSKVDWVLLQSAFQNKWPMEKVKTMLLEMPMAQVRAHDTIWYRLPEASQALFSIMIDVTLPSGDNAIAVGWLPISSLAKLSDAFKSTGREFFVVDDRGYALAFDEQQYVGALLEKDPLVAETMRRRTLSWSGMSTDLAGQPVLAATEKVHASNLYVGVARVQTMLGHFPLGRTIELILWGLALAAFVWLRMDRSNAKPSSPRDAEVLEAKPEPILKTPAPVVNHDELFKQFSGRIAKSFSGPVSSILGHLQMARAKITNGPALEHLDSIEREARRVRETLDNLELLSTSEAHEKKKVDLQEAVLLALEEMKGELHLKGIKIVRDLKPTAQIMATNESLKFALVEIFKVAAESMLGSHDRKITLTSIQVDQTVKLMVEDTGDLHLASGASNQIGLGLTAVRGVVQSLGGTVIVDKKLGAQGNIVRIEFPAVAATVSQKPIELPDQPLASIQEKDPIQELASTQQDDDIDDFIFKSPASTHSFNAKPVVINESDLMDLPAPTPKRSSTEAPVVFGMELSEESPVQASNQKTFVVNIRKPKVRKKN